MQGAETAVLQGLKRVQAIHPTMYCLTYVATVLLIRMAPIFCKSYAHGRAPPKPDSDGYIGVSKEHGSR